MFPMFPINVQKTCTAGVLYVVLIGRHRTYCRVVHACFFSIYFLTCQTSGSNNFRYCIIWRQTTNNHSARIWWLSVIMSLIRKLPMDSVSSMWTPTLKGTVKLQTVPCKNISPIFLQKFPGCCKFDFYRTQVSLVRSMGLVVSNSVRDAWFNLTDVTLADEDTNSILW